MSTHKQKGSILRQSARRRRAAGGGHLSDSLRVGGGDGGSGASTLSQFGFCGFLQTAALTGPGLGNVGVGLLLGARQELYPLLLGVLRGFGALLLGRFASVQVLVVLEGQQVGLLLLQLPLKLLGLALLLELSPFVLLSAGRVELKQKRQEKEVGKDEPLFFFFFTFSSASL